MDKNLTYEIIPSLREGTVVHPVDYNVFRKYYQGLTFDDLAELYGYFAQLRPQDGRYRESCFVEMFNLLRYMTKDDLHIVELGCNKGYLAMDILKQFKNIKTWIGYDFHSYENLGDLRYVSRALSDWFHLIELPDFNVFVSSHTIEHLSGDQVVKTFNHIVSKAEYLLLEIRIYEDGFDWDSWRCAHVLTWGQKQLKKLLTGIGYRLFYEIKGIEGLAIMGWEKVAGKR